MSIERWTLPEQRAFFADLGRVWPGGPKHYEQLKAWCEAHGRPRPSLMPAEQRARLLVWLEDPANRDRVLAWVPPVPAPDAARQALYATAAELQVDSRKEAIRAAAETAGIPWAGQAPNEDGPQIDDGTTDEQLHSFIEGLRAGRAA